MESPNITTLIPNQTIRSISDLQVTFSNGRSIKFTVYATSGQHVEDIIIDLVKDSAPGYTLGINWRMIGEYMTGNINNLIFNPIAVQPLMVSQSVYDYLTSSPIYTMSFTSPEPIQSISCEVSCIT